MPRANCAPLPAERGCGQIRPVLPPALRVALTPTNTLLLAWPAAATGYALQRNLDLAPANWTTLTNTPDLFNGPTSALLDGWDMLTSRGPVSGTMSLLQWSASWKPVITDRGQLLFNSGSSVGTFQAVVVSEPSGLVLLSQGLIGYGLYRTDN